MFQCKLVVLRRITKKLLFSIISRTQIFNFSPFRATHIFTMKSKTELVAAAAAGNSNTVQALPSQLMQNKK